jgi:cellulose synthase/poly-beta-1,6-N-acetylglucosamine synthase-like glycosyltransferase
MGTHPAVVRPTSRVSYVPSAVIVARVDAMRAEHGFTEAMRIGEDVDFVWRLVESAATVRYVPTIAATHLPRRSPGAFVVQRFRYGTSAAALSRRHGTAASPLRTHVTMLAPLVLAAWGRIDLAAAAVAVMYAWFLFSLRSTRTSLVDRLRIITIGARSTLMSAVRAVSRTWWPIFLALSGVFETIGMAFTVCVVVPAIVDVLRRRPRNPIAHLGFFILDDFSYGAGVWAGALKERSVRCMLPALTVSSRRLRSQG